MRSAKRGFTLVEMMVVVAIAGVMAALSVVALRDVLGAKQEIGAARSVALLVKRARIIAIDTHSRVRIDATASTASISSCKSQFGTSACANGGALTPVAGETLHLNNGDLHGVSITAFPGTDLVFAPSGFPEVATSYTYVVDKPDRPGTVSVIVTAAGAVSVQ